MTDDCVAVQERLLLTAAQYLSDHRHGNSYLSTEHVRLMTGAPCTQLLVAI